MVINSKALEGGGLILATDFISIFLFFYLFILFFLQFSIFL